MAPLSRIYVAELWKLLKRPMTWVVSGILLALIVMSYGSFFALLLGPDTGELDLQALTESLVLPDGLYMGMGLVQLLVSALIIILAAGMVGSELSWGTIRTMLMMGAGRTRILIAKALALISFGLLAVITGTALTTMASWGIGVATGDGPSGFDWLTAGFASDTVVALGRTVIAVTLWAFISATITLVTRSLAAGIGVSPALTFIGGQIGALLGQFGSAGTWLGRVLPNAGLDALGALNATTPPSYGAGDWAWILASILGWFLLMIVLAVGSFRRMDTLAAGS